MKNVYFLGIGADPNDSGIFRINDEQLSNLSQYNKKIPLTVNHGVTVGEVSALIYQDKLYAVGEITNATFLDEMINTLNNYNSLKCQDEAKAIDIYVLLQLCYPAISLRTLQDFDKSNQLDFVRHVSLVPLGARRNTTVVYADSLDAVFKKSNITSRSILQNIQQLFEKNKRLDCDFDSSPLDISDFWPCVFAQQVYINQNDNRKPILKHDYKTTKFDSSFLDARARNNIRMDGDISISRGEYELLVSNFTKNNLKRLNDNSYEPASKRIKLEPNPPSTVDSNDAQHAFYQQFNLFVKDQKEQKEKDKFMERLKDYEQSRKGIEKQSLMSGEEMEKHYQSRSFEIETKRAADFKSMIDRQAEFESKLNARIEEISAPKKDPKQPIQSTHEEKKEPTSDCGFKKNTETHNNRLDNLINKLPPIIQ